MQPSAAQACCAHSGLSCSSSLAPRPQQLPQQAASGRRIQRQGSCVTRAVLGPEVVQPLAELAGGGGPLLAGGTLQEVLVGGAVASAVGAALFNGLKGEPQVCELCQGQGGVRCFACQATGKMSALPVNAAQGGGGTGGAGAPRRDVLGRSRSARECRACTGSGMIVCRRCSGTGYCSRN